MATLPPEIDAFPPKPQRGNRTTFSLLFDGVITWFANSVDKVGQACLSAYQNAVAAAASAATATAAADAASATASASQWVSGTTYAKGINVWSPVNLQTYRRSVAGAGATDPSLDGANWQIISRAESPYMRVTHEAAATGGGLASTSNTVHTRALNTVVVNEIAGASLSSNVITLPAGKYRVLARAPSADGNGHQAWLYNATDGAVAALGASAFSQGSASDSVVAGQFTIATPKAFTLRHWVEAGATAGLGRTSATVGGSATNSGLNVVYASVEIWRVA